MTGVKPKNRLSALDVTVLTKELAEMITNSFIDNIYSVGSSKDALFLKVRTRDGKLLFLRADPGVRANITKYVGEKGLSGRVPIFRRFLRNSRIVEVRQHEFERIIELVVSGGGVKSGVLIIELMPRGIVALIDKGSGKVLVSTADLTVKDRVVRPGKPYAYPPSLPNPLKEPPSKWHELLAASRGSLGSALIRGLGIPPEIVNEVLSEELRRLSASAVSLNDVAKIREMIVKFITKVLEEPSPVIIECDGKPVAFHPFKPSNIPAACRILSYESLNAAIDDYFARLETEVEKRKTLSPADAEVEKIKRTIENALNELRSLEERRERLRRILTVFERNYPKLEEIWECVHNTVRKSGWEHVKDSCHVDSYNPRKGVFTVTIDDVEVELSVTQDINSTYFSMRKEYGKLAKKVERSEQAINDLEKKLREKLSRLEEEQSKITLLPRSEWYMHFHWIITSNGFLAIGGRNAQQNEKVVRKYLNDDDIFLHADIHGAPVFVIKCEGKQPPPEDLWEVSVLAVSYSKAWHEGVAALDAYWVWGKQVSKSPPPGQYLPTGSFMVYGKRNYIRAIPLELAIGVEVLENKYYTIVVGPENLVRRKSIAYFVLVPGDEHPAKIANEFLAFLKKLKYRLGNLNSEILLKFIPGPSRILKKFSID